MPLFEYLQQTQRFLREANQDLINPADLISYVNRARREISMRAQAIRVLTPISGSIRQATVTNGGHSYSSNPTVTISAPDFPSGMLPKPQGDQATAQAIVQGGVITAIDIQYGGYGYFQPTVTITDSTGSGAAAKLTVSFINEINQGQEVYPFSQVDLSAFPGVQSVYYVRRNSIIFSNWRYTCRVYSFTTYNAQIRTFPFQFQYAPFFCAQYGRGTAGTYFLYPQPSQPYQLEWDCQCLPQDLIDDQSVEAIPMPFTDAVPYFAAHLGMLELQNYNASKYYLDLFDQFVRRYQQYTQPGTGIDAYSGRW